MVNETVVWANSCPAKDITIYFGKFGRQCICASDKWANRDCADSVCTCHVNCPNRLSLGVAGCCCWTQSQPCLRARAGYSLDKSPAHRRALTSEQCGVQYLAQGHFDMQLCPARVIPSRPALPAELQPPQCLHLFLPLQLFLDWSH